MKKWVFLICTVLLVAVFSIYLLIPSDLTVTRVVPAKCRAGGAFPILGQAANWSRWWPGKKGGFVYKGMSYALSGTMYNVVHVDISKETERYDSRIGIIPIGNLDSILLQWECPMRAEMNPFTRIRQYLRARAIGKNMGEILDSLSLFLGNKENVYGVDIREGGTSDSWLVGTKALYPAYPSTSDIYHLLNKVKDYLDRQGAEQTGYPMVNITPLNGSRDSFQVMVAIPIDRRLAGERDIYFRRLVPGKYLIGEVEGGEPAINKALSGFQQYILDYQRTVMAIPFQLLITDRSKEQDSSRWKTRIYYPIF
jgi:hypothetical protein